jgi:hypothetical protein
VFVPLFVHCSEALQAFYYNKVTIPTPDLAQILHLYLMTFGKFSRDQRVLAEGVRTVWLVFERAGLREEDLKGLCF